MIRLIFTFLAVLTIRINAANLIPNSSFECGAGRGWIYYVGGDAKGNPASAVGELRTTDAWHGATSFRLGSRLISRAIWLTPGTYTMSVYGRSPTSITIKLGIMGGSELAQVPPTTVTFTNGWARYTSTTTLSSNGMYHAKIYSANVLTNDTLVDAMQLEAGASATAYAPEHPVELGLDTAEPNNLLLAGDAKQFRFRFFNNGSATASQGEYLIYDYLNRVIASNGIYQALAANAGATVSAALPAQNGYMRIVSRLYSSNDSWDETSVAVLPYAAVTTQDTNAILGTHPNYSPYHIGRERRSGFGFARDLSPVAGVRWTTVQPTSGAFVYNDVAMANLATNGMVPICNLYPGLSWPTWATNGDGTANLSAYTNYVYQVVARYSQAPYNVHYWETWNEPNTWTTFPNIGNSNTVIASIISDSVDMIRAADPAAYIIALGGMAHAADGLDVWNNLSGTTQGKINAVSCHVYPQDGSTDPNLSESDVHFTSVKDWAAAFAGIRPVWNTESGGWSVGGMKTINSLRQGNYSLIETFSPESLRNEKQQRSQYNVDRCLYACLRSLGWGMRYINYWSKYYQDVMLDLSSTDPTVNEYNNTQTPHGTALLITKSFAGLGLGKITNSAATTMDLFGFTNSGGAVVAAWNYDRTRKSLTLTNSTGIGLVDCMGNQVTTNTAVFTIARTPQYLISSTLSLAQLSNDVKQASVAAVADTVAPYLAFDVAPSGPWSGSANATLIKWSAFDTHVIPWTTAPTSTNIVYKWHLDNNAYSAYSPSNHVWLSNLASGSHTFYVTAMDASLNSAEYSYVFIPQNRCN